MYNEIKAERCKNLLNKHAQSVFGRYIWGWQSLELNYQSFRLQDFLLNLTTAVCHINHWEQQIGQWPKMVQGHTTKLFADESVQNNYN